MKRAPVDLCNAERPCGDRPAPVAIVDRDPKPLEGHWLGGAGAQVNALKAENRRLRARIADLEQAERNRRGGVDYITDRYTLPGAW